MALKDLAMQYLEALNPINPQQQGEQAGTALKQQHDQPSMQHFINAIMAMGGITPMGSMEMPSPLKFLQPNEVLQSAMGTARSGEFARKMLDSAHVQAKHALAGHDMMDPGDAPANRQILATLEGNLRKFGKLVGGEHEKNATSVADQLRQRIKANIEVEKLEGEMGHRKYAKRELERPAQENESSPLLMDNAAEMLWRQKPSGGYQLDPWNQDLFRALTTGGQSRNFINQMAQWAKEKQASHTPGSDINFFTNLNERGKMSTKGGEATLGGGSPVSDPYTETFVNTILKHILGGGNAGK